MTRPPHPLHGRHELLWEGKYDADGRRHAPSFDPEGASLEWIERYPPASTPSVVGASAVIPANWRNRLILGDNRDALACLLPEFKGAVQLVYLDPPFGSEADYRMGGEGRGKGALAYRDRWGAGDASYLHFMAERLALMREFLAPSGCLFLHCDWHSVAALRLLLDELFGADHFINEIVWYYYNKYSRGRHCLPRAHDTILVYGRTRTPTVYPLRLKREVPQRQLMRRNVNGVLRNARDADGKLMYQIVHDKKADDVWTIPQLQPASTEWTGYATQKHPLLLERILSVASKPGDLVADFFCGSGTTLTVAQRMERRFLGGDLGETALHITRRRLVLASSHPELAVLEVKRKAGALLHKPGGRSLAAQRAWVLKKLGATHVTGKSVAGTPVTGQDGVHGRLLGTSIHVHVGDGQFQASQAVALAHKRKGRLICCAWDFEPAFWDKLAATKGSATILPIVLPKDWLSHGDASEAPVRVLPRLHSVAKPSARGSVRVRLVGWIEPELATAIKGAASKAVPSRVEMWAVDSEWSPNRPFTAAWTATRPRRGRLSLTTPPLALSDASKTPRGILVRAWDASGTSATTWIEIKP